MEKLYYKDSYIKEFIAQIKQVVKKDDKFHIVLDKTAFFPGGGGQFCDVGKIDNYEIVDVYEADKKIYHVINEEPTKLNDVSCCINWEIREDGMHQHLAQHVLSGCFYTLFDKNTCGFHLGSDISTIDIVGDVSYDEIVKAEKMANDIISENIKVSTITPSKDELENISIRRDLPITDDEIRIVNIGDLDSNACCGVHPGFTIDLKMIKIRKYEKNRGATRIEFLAGKRAVDYSLKRDRHLTDICRYLKSTEETSLDMIKGLNDKLDASKDKIKNLENMLANLEIKELIEASLKVGELSIIKKVYTDVDLEYIKRLTSMVNEDEDVVALFTIKNENRVNLIFACSKNLKELNMGVLLRESISLVNGKGGGSNFLAQGSGTKVENLEESIKYAFNMIKQKI